MLVFEERGNTEYPKKNLLGQGQETLMTLIAGHWWKASVFTTVPSLLPLSGRMFFLNHIVFVYSKQQLTRILK